ncbi:MULTISPECIES: mechanosensitive ion channel family protein [unclassified Crossiella]|uniref:mechanosensitive ion channel family protein n=1 Tax=unclassified Crossiella TaxID=2620835 RepID=UPI001FFE7420|nr:MULTISPECIES: mechanosensitive ion channel family protein [unclassified Crossiella]MCK2241210.1 mechanosensitive ion channel family protein [Crossiella sp. S99.2]MCK2253646.1 mechanosensitive ion channel family protein [Crossiella sp. S99.1]
MTAQLSAREPQEWLFSSAEWLANNQWIITKPIKIILVMVGAFLLRYLLRRMIDKLTTNSSAGRVPVLLRPLKERAPEAIKAAAGPLLSERRAQRAKTIGSILKSITSILVFGIAFLMILETLTIDITPIIASAGVLGVAIGFGAQNLIKDFLSGIFMMLEDQYGVGDVVDLGPATGTIETVGLRVTTLRDVNGTVWYVRNGEVLRVGNSSQGFAVAVVDFPVAHNVDAARATELMAEVVTDAATRTPLLEDVLEPPEVLGVEKVTADTVTLRMTVKVRPGRQWAVQRALRAKIMAAYDEAGIEPPYPNGRPNGPEAPPAPEKPKS